MDSRWTLYPPISTLDDALHTPRIAQGGTGGVIVQHRQCSARGVPPHVHGDGDIPGDDVRGEPGGHDRPERPEQPRDVDAGAQPGRRVVQQIPGLVAALKTRIGHNIGSQAPIGIQTAWPPSTA